MATAQAIVDRIQTVLRGIHGDPYNLNIPYSNVKQEYVLFDQVPSYPFIGIGSASESPSIAEDQVTYGTTVTLEMLGYVQSETEAVKKALQMVEDIKAAIYADPELNDQVYELSLGFDTTSISGVGIVACVLRCKTTYTLS